MVYLDPGKNAAPIKEGSIHSIPTLPHNELAVSKNLFQRTRQHSQLTRLALDDPDTYALCT